ncbi:transcription initiation factor TFIID subunit 4b [Andrographis paniculata]|uniref:transcription initiation factor TFIID subunit 4b n=1 Tax=Andrographis paniculata TaxID=175694 RepID=UPI0021E87E24|nr:transcription initiation factor TFIID subunit 4b [Andrographis paniculata]
MDPNFMKFLEEDEDETMHSGADVEAFTAELNRDIEGNASESQQPSDSDIALPQVDHQTSSELPPQWQTSGPDEIANFQPGQAVLETEGKEQQSSQLDLHQHVEDSENKKVDNASSHEPNVLLHNPSSDVPLKTQDDQNSLAASQPMSMHTSGDSSLDNQNSDPKPNRGIESHLHNSQNITNRPSMEMGSNDHQPAGLELKDQQSLSAGIGNQQTVSTGISNEQTMPTMIQRTTGMGMSSQQSMTSGIGSQLPVTNSNQQPGAQVKLNKQVPFGMLLPIIQPQLDKDRAMQLHTLYLKLKKNEISKDGFVRHMRSIVGDQMLKMAVYKLQNQAARSSQAGANPFQSLQVSARQHMQSDISTSTNDNNLAKSLDVESQADSQGIHINHMSTSSSSGLSQDRKHPTFATQGFNKQQHMHFSQSSFPSYGNAGSSYPPFSATNSLSSTSVRSQTHDSQMRQSPAHQNMPANHLGPTANSTSMINMSKFERPNTLGDPKKIQAGNLNAMNSNAALQQNQAPWSTSSSKEQRLGISSSMPHVKQEPVDQSNEQLKTQMSSSHGPSSLSSPLVKQGNAVPGNLKDESFEMQSSRTGFTPSASLGPGHGGPSSVSSPMEINMLSSSRMPSLTSIGPGITSKVPTKKPLVGQKKPMDPVSSPPSSKKQKVSGAFLDQSIEHLNDVTAVSGVNLREEEEQLLSGSKEDTRVSEASRRAVQEEEERLILHKIPLQKKVVEIMAKCGLKNMSNDVERCLSLCVEERMRGLVSNLIRLSKQRVDMEKPRHRTIVTSDVRQQIMAINNKAREEWEKKQAETEKSQKLNDSENSAGADGDKEKDEGRARSKVNKEEDDKMRTTAANVAVRAATGVGDMLSRWQLMIEAKQKQGGSDTASSSQPSKDPPRKPSTTASKSTRENQEGEKRDSSSAFSTPASVRKVGRNQVIVPRVARSISIKDVIAILEREPQMSKSTLLYRLYNKVSADAVGE